MRVLLYTWSACGFCARARELLEASDVEWTEHSLDGDRARLRELQRVTGLRTVPIAFADGEPIGGLAELERWLAEGAGGAGS